MHTKNTNQVGLCPVCQGPIREGRRFCSPACSNRHRSVDIDQRFWSRVDKTGDCWIWMGSRQASGYGRIFVGGKRLEGAHRVAWMLTNGPIPDGLWVLHRCDTPFCVRPDHLFLGSSDDNIRDMVAKARHNHGATSYAKLTEANAIEILRRCRVGNESHRVIAQEFGVCRATVSLISRRVTWKHLD